MRSYQSLLHELIGLIYETADDPELWPTLLAGLAEAVEDASQDPMAGVLPFEPVTQQAALMGGTNVTRLISPPRQHQNEDELVQQLIPHFQRALRINHRLAEDRQQRAHAMGILEHLPLGVILVDDNAVVRTANQPAWEIMANTPALRVHENHLTAATHSDTLALRKLIQQVAHQPEGEPQVLTLSHQPALSLLVIPNGQENGGYSCTLFIAPPERRPHVSQTLLKSLFGLSPAEARLTRLLVAGESLDAAAGQLNISPHTARAQLKAIFAKTGTNRQPQLVQRVLTSPAMFVPETATDTAPGNTDNPRPLARKGFLRLACGRSLHYAEYGDPAGDPVFFFHSIVGSHRQIHPDPRQTDALGIRWIVPDRPGYGESDPHPNRTLTDWAEDIRQLADHLQLDRYYLAGYSAGGAHAAACARHHPERVIRLALISTMAPFNSLSALAGMPPTNRMLMGMARYTPGLLNPFMRLLIQGLVRNPQQITNRHIELWPEADREAMAQPGVREFMVDVFHQAIRQGPDAIVAEQIMLARPWGFDPAEIETETHIWHGDADIHVPFGMLEPVTRIPRHTLYAIPGMGHYLLLAHWRKIFETLTA